MTEYFMDATFLHEKHEQFPWLCACWQEIFSQISFIGAASSVLGMWKVWVDNVKITVDTGCRGHYGVWARQRTYWCPDKTAKDRKIRSGQILTVRNHFLSRNCKGEWRRLYEGRQDSVAVRIEWNEHEEAILLCALLKCWTTRLRGNRLLRMYQNNCASLL